jgi:hypothetical protein
VAAHAERRLDVDRHPAIGGLGGLVAAVEARLGVPRRQVHLLGVDPTLGGDHRGEELAGADGVVRTPRDDRLRRVALVRQHHEVLLGLAIAAELGADPVEDQRVVTRQRAVVGDGVAEEVGDRVGVAVELTEQLFLRAGRFAPVVNALARQLYTTCRGEECRAE